MGARSLVCTAQLARWLAMVDRLRGFSARSRRMSPSTLPTSTRSHVGVEARMQRSFRNA
jgi:hypothetical protein